MANGHFSLPHSASRATSPSSSTTLPRSHSRAWPFLVHTTSSSMGSPPFSHFFTCSSLNPAARSRSAPCCFQRSLSRMASSASSQASSTSEPGFRPTEGSYFVENRESMPSELPLRAPRPRVRTVGSGGGGRGPTIASRGSESDAGLCGRRRLFSAT